MFEYDGDQYTEQEIIDAASKAGLSFEDYTSKHGITLVDNILRINYFVNFI